MLRALAVALLVALTAPAAASEGPDETVVAQEQQRPQQAPKRDCERTKREEGVS